MSLSLRMESGLTRATVLIDEDSIAILDHAADEDRIHKILYSRISAITVTKSYPVWRIIAVVAMLGLFALPVAALYSDNFEAAMMFLFPVGLFMLILAFYILSGRTTIRIYRGSEFRDLPFVVPPWTMRKFLYNLTSRIDQTQARENERLAELYSSGKTAPESAPPPPFVPQGGEAPPTL